MQLHVCDYYPGFQICDFAVVNAYKVFPRQRLQSTYILMLDLLSLSLSHLFD